MLARQSASASRRRPRDSAVAGRRAHDYRIACDGVGPAGRQFPGSQYSAGGMPVFSRERTPRGEKSRRKGIGFYWELGTNDLLFQGDSAFFEEITTTSRSHLGSKCSHLLPQKRQKSALSARLGSQLPRLAGPGRRYRPTHVDFGALVFCARRAGYPAPSAAGWAADFRAPSRASGRVPSQATERRRRAILRVPQGNACAACSPAAVAPSPLNRQTTVVRLIRFLLPLNLRGCIHTPAPSFARRRCGKTLRRVQP